MATDRSHETAATTLEQADAVVGALKESLEFVVARRVMLAARPVL